MDWDPTPHSRNEMKHTLSPWLGLGKFSANASAPIVVSPARRETRSELELGYGTTLPVPLLRAMRTQGGTRGARHGLFFVTCSVAFGVMQDDDLEVSPRFIGAVCAY